VPPSPQPPPLDAGQFDALVESALSGIPEEFKPYLANVTIVVEEEPAPALLRQMGLDPRTDTLFGLYQGVPLPRRSHDHGNTIPDHITVFRGPLLRACRSAEELRDQVRRTVVHEIAHFFGFDEHRIRRLGY